MSNVILDYLHDEDGQFGTIKGDNITTILVPQNHTFITNNVFPVLQERQDYTHDTSSMGVEAENFKIGYSTTVEISVVSSGAGYNNTLGAYTIGADGTIQQVQFAYTNVKDPIKHNASINKLEKKIDQWEAQISNKLEKIEAAKSGSKLIDILQKSVSAIQDKINDLAQEIDALKKQHSSYKYSYEQTEGSSLGLFIVANGDNVNKDYSHLDLENGTLRFVFNLGGAEEREARITDPAKSISLVHELDGVKTVIQGYIYHATDNDSDHAINPDSKQHTISGLADGNDPSVLRIGFEDLKNLGDADYNDVVVDIRVASGEAPEDNYDDILLGDSGNNIFIGGLGNNTISGRGGSDTVDYSDAGPNLVVDLNLLFATNGATFTDRLIQISNIIGTDYTDRITGDASANILYGMGGNDTIFGGDNDDLIYGGSGNDRLYGDGETNGVGNDIIYGEDGDDIISGGAGDDTLQGNDGNDTVFGGIGHDDISGGSGDDILYGDNNSETAQDGDDVIRGGDGNDTLSGGGGNDLLIGGSGSDILYGGSGNDTADYSESTTAIQLSLTTGIAIDGAGGRDQLYSIENASGSVFADRLEGNSANNILDGMAGNDTIYGWAGNDTLYGGAGADNIYGGHDNDTIYGGADNDVLSGEQGDDTLFGEDGVDQLWGGAGHDTLDGGAGNDTLYGDFLNETINDGNDVLRGGAGSDTLIGRGGNDILYGGDGADQLWGGSGADSFVFLSGEAGIDVIRDFNMAEGDTIDISDIIADYFTDPINQSITDFVQITNNAYNSFVFVDKDGGGDNFVQIATITNVTGLNDEQQLITSGVLIA